MFRGQKMIRREELKKRLLSYSQNADEEMEQALTKIKDSEDYKLIKMIYLEGKSQERVAMELYYDRSTISRRLNRLLKKLVKIMNERKQGTSEG